MPSKIDSLLEPLLSRATEAQADEFISGLITTVAGPVIKQVIRYKLHFSPVHLADRIEAEDIYQEVVLQLLEQLRQLRAQPDEYPIRDIRGLAAVIAHRACSRWMRRQFPERHALKARLYYLLTRQRGLAVWQGERGELIAGLTEWQGEKSTVSAERLAQLAGDEQLLSCIRLLKPRKQESIGALAAIFRQLQGPIEFDRLVGGLATMLEIRDQPLQSTDEDQNSFAESALPRERDPAWQVEKRIFLQRLWEELRQLPRHQRAALLLNLKGAEGRGCIALFPATGVATLRELADALEIEASRLAELWNELPLEDSKIAELLKLTRQQVINARKAARERLARRLKGFI